MPPASPRPPGPWPALNAPEGGYVFVVTYGRSGSTLLQNLLNALPGWCIRGENANALEPLARSWHQLANAEPRQGMAAQGSASAPDHPWYGAELADPARYGRALADLFVREVLALPPGTRVGGFKEIRFHTSPAFFPAYMDFLRRFFPQARFVFNLRDHGAVARSGWWAQMPEATVRAQLAAAEALYETQLARHPDRCFRLRYEDYADRPEGLRALFDFLGEPFDPATLAPVLDRRLHHLHPPPDPAP